MRFLRKLRDIIIALLPILVLVFFVHIFLFKIETGMLLKFLLAVLIVAVGEALFLTGVDSTIIPMGELMVGTVNKFSKLAIFIIFATVFGFFATIAEPDVAVFVEQVLKVDAGISSALITFCIGAGVALLVVFAIIRIIKNIPLKYIYIVIFAIIFCLASQVDTAYVALCFDAGGATTGMISAPFLLAIASSISSKFSKEKSSEETFGMIGMASLGPVIAMLILLLFSQNSGASIETTTESVSLFVSVLKNSFFAVIPLAIIFAIYDLIFIKLPIRKKVKFGAGLLLTFVGLFMFSFAVEFGFESMGEIIGEFLSKTSDAVIIVFCIIFGFSLTFAEPSVIVLAKQVETKTNGNIKSTVVMLSIAVSMAVAVLLSALRILYNINFFYIILIGYSIALILMFFVNSMFTGLAFDSGGVASGPMTSAFILPMMIALATNTTGAINGFGIIGIVAMTPIVVIQFMGLSYQIITHITKKKDQKRAIRLSYTSEMYSNIIALEVEHNKLMKEKQEKIETQEKTQNIK